MLMMGVRKMLVGVGHGLVPVRMAVPRARRVSRRMLVLVVQVAVVLGQVQPDADGHEYARQRELHGHGFGSGALAARESRPFGESDPASS